MRAIRASRQIDCRDRTEQQHQQQGDNHVLKVLQGAMQDRMNLRVRNEARQIEAARLLSRPANWGEDVLNYSPISSRDLARTVAAHESQRMNRCKSASSARPIVTAPAVLTRAKTAHTTANNSSPPGALWRCAVILKTKRRFGTTM